MDQFFFMPDRHDPGFCCVRYITDVRLREWKVYLQPVATRELVDTIDLFCPHSTHSTASTKVLVDVCLYSLCNGQQQPQMQQLSVLA